MAPVAKQRVEGAHLSSTTSWPPAYPSTFNELSPWVPLCVIYQQLGPLSLTGLDPELIG